MAGDIRSVASQASALMVAAVHRDCRASVTEARLITLHDTIASLKEELHNTKAECRVLSEHNCIVVYEKAILVNHVFTLESQTERLEDHVSSLTGEKGVLANKLARCQRQLDRARVDGSVARGGLQWAL